MTDVLTPTFQLNCYGRIPSHIFDLLQAKAYVYSTSTESDMIMPEQTPRRLYQHQPTSVLIPAEPIPRTRGTSGLAHRKADPTLSLRSGPPQRDPSATLVFPPSVQDIFASNIGITLNPPDSRASATDIKSRLAHLPDNAITMDDYKAAGGTLADLREDISAGVIFFKDQRFDCDTINYVFRCFRQKAIPTVRDLPKPYYAPTAHLSDIDESCLAQSNASTLGISADTYAAAFALGTEIFDIDPGPATFGCYNPNEWETDYAYLSSMFKISPDGHFCSSPSDTDTAPTSTTSNTDQLSPILTLPNFDDIPMSQAHVHTNADDWKDPTDLSIPLNPESCYYIDSHGTASLPEEVYLELYYTPSAPLLSETNPFGLDESKEVLATPDMLVMDKIKMKDLSTYDEEMKDRYFRSCHKEISQLLAIHAFAIEKFQTTIERVPQPDGTIKTALINKVKVDSDGNHIKDKSRLVAKGYCEKVGKDFFSSFSPTVSMVTIRLMFAIACSLDIPLYSADIPNAFIRAGIDSHIKIRLPPGVKLVHGDIDTDNGYGIRLLKALYGLKQSPALFNRELSKFMHSIGFSRLTADTSLYGIKWEDGSFILAPTQVDDLLIVASNDARRKWFHEKLVETFDVKDYGPIHTFMGLRVVQDLRAGTLSIDCEQQINKLFKNHPILNKVGKASAPSLQKYTVPDDAKPYSDLETYMTTNFPSIVGALIFPATTCRPDLAYEVSYAARSMHSATRIAITRLHHLLKYVNTHRHFCLKYYKSGGPSRKYLNELPAFVTQMGSCPDDVSVDDPLGLSDANHAPTDAPRRRSTTGFCFFFRACLISWKSKLQSITSASSHDSELIALSTAANEGIFIRNLLIDVIHFIPDYPRDINQPLHMYCDNLSTVFSSNNPVSSSRTRHIETRYWVIRDYIEAAKLRVAHLRGRHNLADYFTKSIAFGQAFTQCLLWLGMTSIKSK